MLYYLIYKNSGNICCFCAKTKAGAYRKYQYAWIAERMFLSLAFQPVSLILGMLPFKEFVNFHFDFLML